MFRSHGDKRDLFFLVFIAIMLVLASSAFARAGGGGSYGGSSGGGGGGGSGAGYIFYLLIRLAIHKPLIGVPLLIVVIILMIKFSKKAKGGYETHTITKAGKIRREQEHQEMQAALDALEQRDPGFSKEAFLQKVNKAFIAVQDAWSNQDISSVNQFISDGIDERFTLQIEMQKAEGYRNRMENITVQSSRIVGILSDSHFDTIHVEIIARADDTDVDVETGKRIRKNTSAPFTEYWSFLRKPGVQTLKGKGLVEGVCPNCGAPIELSDSGKCENCDSVLTSGEYDWVLAEITQSIEWNLVSDKSLIPGFESMEVIDPGFNLQHIEDRTSVIFWRLIKAWFTNEVSEARKVTLPSFLEGFDKQLSNTRSDNDWLFFKDAAVGTVEVQNIIPGTKNRMDRIEVLVKWSGINARRNEDSKVRVTGRKIIRPQIYTLVRKHGIKTHLDQSFRSSHCPGCGAPYEGGSTGKCEYCGRPLNDGSQDWVLESVQRFSASRITAKAIDGIERTALVPPELLLSSMVKAMYADGEVDDKEMKTLSSFAVKRNITDEHLTEIINTVKSGQNTLPAPANQVEAREILAAMSRMVLADGRLTSSEKSLLQTFGESQGLVWADVKIIISQQKAKLYIEAKKAIRETRTG
ncbi:MAG: TIM44-like domain-containing protein [Candidatus Fermentibacteria bacterium]